MLVELWFEVKDKDTLTKCAGAHTSYAGLSPLINNECESPKGLVQVERRGDTYQPRKTIQQNNINDNAVQTT
jgi:hypothetical protein